MSLMFASSFFFFLLVEFASCYIFALHGFLLATCLNPFYSSACSFFFLLCAVVLLVVGHWVVGCTTPQPVEGCSGVQSSTASSEWVRAPSRRVKPPTKSFSTCSLVCFEACCCVRPVWTSLDTNVKHGEAWRQIRQCFLSARALAGSRSARP